MLTSHLQKQNLPVSVAVNMQQALEEHQREPADLMIIDLLLPDGNGLELMQNVKKMDTPVEVIMMTGFGTIESAVEAMQAGATNYLLKPFTLPQLDVALNQVKQQRNLIGQNKYLQEQLQSESHFSDFLYQSPEMQSVKDFISQVAPTDATVLIQGESGTGKELLSHSIHLKSPRHDKPYIKVNCAAVPENLLESEFFGHEKGAFTGATNRREGRFELANGGTILLDEITEISLNLQAKLLRVLQEQEFERVGGSRSINVDVRVIATTNRALIKAVEEGHFRQDLYFRLNVLPLKVPPLRERKGEVEFLLRSFLEKFSKKHSKPVPLISDTALKYITQYNWPGNVRELQNYAERSVILSQQGKDIDYSEFVNRSESITPSTHRGDTNGSDDLDDNVGTIEEMERKLIQQALKTTNGNRNEAAKMLGISARTLRNKLDQYEELDVASS
jgi:DNA-binding NtrC family response regulator